MGQRKDSGGGLVILGATAVALAALAVVDLGLLDGDGGGRSAFVRHTARSSLALFLVAFSASALARLWPGPLTRWVLRRRRSFGLALALSHFTHLAAIFLLHGLALFERRSPVGLAIGAVPYLFLGLMALTSSDRAVAWLGRRWRTLHWTGMHVLWAGFLLPYTGRVARSPVYAIPMVLLAAALALRVAARIRRRRAAPLASSAG